MEFANIHARQTKNGMGIIVVINKNALLTIKETMREIAFL